LNEEDEEAAKLEEDEAKSTQKRWASAIDDAELSLDLLSDDIVMHSFLQLFVTAPFCAY